ncbi:phosphatase PAP2 family protein [Actinomadura parmotrematis]|uniref:Phosphatase PAP2 family protein n=1 Tax=Actinomadura parmotrematis TaxID=2864039 RepID=A0ABS7FUL6_9ACTN|nr:phosphatase PAP2 family protein [Actinomadura parmotrematis]MBW8484101.1 phosphatase PAP2 family protein [Actinomadura parmotrematis]
MAIPFRPLTLRLALASTAVALAAVPFTFLLWAAVAHWGPMHRLDDDATRALNGYALDHRALVRPLQATSYVFHAWVFRLAIVALAGRLLHRGAKRLALWAVTTITVAGLLGLLLKVVVDRPRPSLPQPIAHAPGGSFPSGHAMTAAVGTAVIVLILLPVLRGAWKAAAWTLAALVTVASGLCRVALGVHYLSDVLAGWILGAAVVIATVAAFETWRRAEHRPPAHPAEDGVEPEAADRIAPSHRTTGAPGNG